jgi:hypothetical protein
MLADPLTKDLPPNVFRHHVVDNELRRAYDLVSKGVIVVT